MKKISTIAGLVAALVASAGFLTHSLRSRNAQLSQSQVNYIPLVQQTPQGTGSYASSQKAYQNMSLGDRITSTQSRSTRDSDNFKDGIEALVSFRENGGNELIGSYAFDTLASNPQFGGYFSEIMGAMSRFQTRSDYESKALRFFELIESSDQDMKETYLKYPFIFMSNPGNLEGIPDCDGM